MAVPSPTTRNRYPDKRVLVARLTEDDVGRIFDLLGTQGRRPVGTANWIAHSPFREDRHRSFTIRKADGVWHDKATGEGGSLFDAVMRLRGCTFPEALTWVSAQVDVMLAVGAPPPPAPPPGTSGGARGEISRWLPIPVEELPRPRGEPYPPPPIPPCIRTVREPGQDPEHEQDGGAVASQLPFPLDARLWSAPAYPRPDLPPHRRAGTEPGGQP